MELPIFKIDGSEEKESIAVNFGLTEKKPSKNAVYYAVISQMTNSRQGTHSTKSRSMVRGGGRKPYRQKGTGNARAGTNNSPLWRGGSRIFGPVPHSYSYKLPKKVKRLRASSTPRLSRRSRMGLSNKASTRSLSAVRRRASNMASCSASLWAASRRKIKFSLRASWRS